MLCRMFTVHEQLAAAQEREADLASQLQQRRQASAEADSIPGCRPAVDLLATPDAQAGSHSHAKIWMPHHHFLHRVFINMPIRAVRQVVAQQEALACPAEPASFLKQAVQQMRRLIICHKSCPRQQLYLASRVYAGWSCHSCP